jgi:hypothetical protein
LTDNHGIALGVSVFRTTLQETFPAARRLHRPASNVVPIAGADGTRVVFTRSNFTDGTVVPGSMSLILMIADVNPGGGWVNARPITFQ